MDNWISVKDKLPDQPGDYIVATELMWSNDKHKVLCMEFEIVNIDGKEKKRWKWNGIKSPWLVSH